MNLMLFTNFYLRTYGKNRLQQLGARMGFCDLQFVQAMRAGLVEESKSIEKEQLTHEAHHEVENKLKQN